MANFRTPGSRSNRTMTNQREGTRDHEAHYHHVRLRRRVMQGIGGPDEDRSGFERGAWTTPLFDNEAATFLYQVFEGADAFLVGRRAYEVFSGYWGAKADTGIRPIAVAFNTRPKYVA